MDIYIFNPLIETIYKKYSENQTIDDQPIISHQRFHNNFNGVDFEMIRVSINCKIDELRNVLNVFQPQYIKFKNNGDDCIASIYLTNQNQDLFRLSCLFEMDVFLVIDIYREDYKKLTWCFESKVFDSLIINLDKIKII